MVAKPSEHDLPDQDRYAHVFDGAERRHEQPARDPRLYLPSGAPTEALAPVDFEGNLVHERVTQVVEVAA